MFGSRRNSEVVTLTYAPGTISNDAKAQTIVTEFVAGVESASVPPVFHHWLPEIEHTSTEKLRLPRDLTRRLGRLVRDLYSPDRTVQEYDCLSGMDFLMGFRDRVELREHHYIYRAPVVPDHLKIGSAYGLAENGNIIHGMVASTPNRVLHVAGPQSDLAHTAIADVMQIWPGQLVELTARPEA